jgi:hypothetical protein
MATYSLLHYHLLAYRRDQFWLPAGLWGLFALVAFWFAREDKASQIAASYLGVVLPLLAGVLSASAFVDDPALELQLAAPRSPARLLGERSALLLGVIALAAVLYQVLLAFLDINLDPLGNLAVRQLIWLVPSLAIMGLAHAAALGAAQTMVGAMAAGLVWLLQLLLRGWFAQSAWAKYVLLFLGVEVPGTPDLPANLLCLLALAAALAGLSVFCLRRPERYL